VDAKQKKWKNQLGERMGKLLGAIATKLLSEKVLIAIVMKLGDWLVKRSSNDLDDKIWAEVSKALEENA